MCAEGRAHACRACSLFPGVFKGAHSGPTEVPRSSWGCWWVRTLSLHLLQRMELFLDYRTVTVCFLATRTVSALTGTCIICLPLNFRRNCNLNPDTEVLWRGLPKEAPALDSINVTGIPERDRVTFGNSCGLFTWGSGSIRIPPEWGGDPKRLTSRWVMLHDICKCQCYWKQTKQTMPDTQDTSGKHELLSSLITLFNSAYASKTVNISLL